jgi:hypothetical protein
VVTHSCAAAGAGDPVTRGAPPEISLRPGPGRDHARPETGQHQTPGHSGR